MCHLLSWKKLAAIFERSILGKNSVVCFDQPGSGLVQWSMQSSPFPNVPGFQSSQSNQDFRKKHSTNFWKFSQGAKSAFGCAVHTQILVQNCAPGFESNPLFTHFGIILPLYYHLKHKMGKTGKQAAQHLFSGLNIQQDS